MHKKRKSLFPLVFAVLTALALLIGSLDAFVYVKYYRSGKLKSMMSTAEKLDYTDPDGNTEYGRLYCSPIDEEHIVTENGENSAGYIDNEVLIVAADGVTREQIAELASSYDAEIVGEIEAVGDYQLRLRTTPEGLDAVAERLGSNTERCAGSSPVIRTSDKVRLFGLLF